MYNIPTEEGEYLWVDKTGCIGKRNLVYLIPVCDVGKPIGEVWLRAYWRGGWYDVNCYDIDEEWECWPKRGWIA